MKLLGLGNHNIHTASQMFKSSQMLDFDGEIPEGTHTLLVPTVNLFMKHKAKLEKTKNTVIVFDTPVLLEYLHPIRILDLMAKKASYSFRFKPLSAKEANEAIADTEHVKAVDYKYIDIIPTLLQASQGSILNPILNYLYAIPDTDKRTYHQKLVYTWLRSDKGIEDLHKSVLKFTKQKKVTKGLSRLSTFLVSELANNTRKALVTITEAKALKKPVNFKKIEKDFKVSAFDLKYLLKALRKIELQHTYPDGLDLSHLHRDRKKVAPVKTK